MSPEEERAQWDELDVATLEAPFWFFVAEDCWVCACDDDKAKHAMTSAIQPVTVVECPRCWQAAVVFIQQPDMGEAE